MNVRLSSLCATKGICSKLDAKKYIKLGLLKLNNEIVREDLITSPDAKVELLKRASNIQHSKLTILLHKPKGYLSTYSKQATLCSRSLLNYSNRSEEDTRNKLEPYKLRDLVSIAPLETSSSGLEVFSQDKTLGVKFAKALQEFQVEFQSKPTPEVLSALNGDVYLDGDVVPLSIEVVGHRFAKIKVVGSCSKLRRICLVAGIEVKHLSRLSIGNVVLDDLELGKCNGQKMLSAFRMGSKQHGWRFEKLLPTRKRWVRIEHPPRQRSKIIKLEGGHDKLFYVCNGWIDGKFADAFKDQKHAVVDDGQVKTPVLAFAKGKTHELLETISMDEVLEFERAIPDITSAFKDVQEQQEQVATDDVDNSHQSINFDVE